MNFQKHIPIVLILFGILLIGASIYSTLIVGKAEAQCGTQMSSCKNCHEVQGKKPVNSDGTGWHQSHAFGDFCQFCHSGNVQSMVAEEAHQGMVPPLQDVQASCGNCHPDDLMDKAQVYGGVLGIEIGKGGPKGSDGKPAEPKAPEKKAEVQATAEIVLNTQEVLDYNKRYEEMKSGSIAVNWGNIIVILLIIGMLFGGGYFVYWNEKRLQKSKTNLEVKAPLDTEEVLDIKDYPQEIILLLPSLAKLTPSGRKALKRLLDKPEEASELLYSLSQIDTDLLKQVQNLDGRARAILMAMAG